MASNVAGVIGWGVSDGELLDATEVRHSTVSAFDVTGGTTPLASRGGIIPAGGNPLQVAAKGTPAMKVTVNAGRVVVPGNSSTTPPFGLTLTANTDLDVTTSHATLPRIDLVIAEIVSDGTSASYGEFRVLAGTPNASPVRPTLPTGTSHCVSLKTIAVGAAVTTITSPNVTTNAADLGALSTAAPGGMVTVPNLAGATGLPPGAPFFSTVDNLPGVMLPTGVPEFTTGMMLRFFVGTATTDSNGDISCSLGLRIGGTLTGRSFPNGILFAQGSDMTDPIFYSQALIFKYLASTSSVSTARFRVYGNTTGPLVSSTIIASVVAVGY